MVKVAFSSVPPFARMGVIHTLGLPVLMFHSVPQTFLSGAVRRLAVAMKSAHVQLSAGGGTPICLKRVLLYVQSKRLSWKGTASSCFS